MIELLKARNYRIEVSIIANAQELWFANDHRLIISGSIYSQPGVSFRIELEQSVPARYYYRLIIGEFRGSDLIDAKRLAKRAKGKLKIDTKIIKLTGKKIVKTRYPNEKKVYLVATQYFATKDLALLWKDAASRFYSVYLYKEVLKPSSGKIKLTDARGKIIGRFEKEVTIVPEQTLSTTIVVPRKDKFGMPKKSRQKADYYRGGFVVYVNDDGGLGVVNFLRLEAYLYGVVSSEIGANVPAETAKAQAVAARTSIISKLASKHHFNDRFDSCSTVHCQTYNSARSETVSTNNAVYATRRVVIVRDNELVDAVYSSSCGGITVDSKDIWHNAKEHYLISIYDGKGMRRPPDLSTESDAADWVLAKPDVFCNTYSNSYLPSYLKKYFRWQLVLSGEEVRAVVNKRYSVGAIRDIEVLRRSASGRIKALKVIGIKKTVIVDQELDIRRLLGDMYSTFCVFIKRYDANRRLKELTIKGAGHGHGAGMCQVGAFTMGKRGYDYKQILHHYFNGVELRRLY